MCDGSFRIFFKKCVQEKEMGKSGLCCRHVFDFAVCGIFYDSAADVELGEVNWIKRKISVQIYIFVYVGSERRLVIFCGIPPFLSCILHIFLILWYVILVESLIC